MGKLTIPEAAMPVVKVLRRDVPKPKEMPQCVSVSCNALRWRIGNDVFCPMGLHKKSLASAPSFGENFAGGECSDFPVRIFYQWWDHIEIDDAKAAIDAIWPRKRAAKKRKAVRHGR